MAASLCARRSGTRRGAWPLIRSEARKETLTNRSRVHSCAPHARFIFHWARRDCPGLDFRVESSRPRRPLRRSAPIGNRLALRPRVVCAALEVSHRRGKRKRICHLPNVLHYSGFIRRNRSSHSNVAFRLVCVVVCQSHAFARAFFSFFFSFSFMVAVMCGPWTSSSSYVYAVLVLIWLETTL